MAQLQIELADLQELVSVEKKEAMDTLTMLGFPTEELEDGRLNVEVTPNRPDALCIEGVARVLRCYKTGKPAEYNVGKPKIKLAVDESVKSVRPFIGGAAIRNVKMTDSLLRSMMQVQEKLHETLGRKRRKMAIGIYDLDTLSPPFRYFACGRKEISFVPLEKKTKMTPEEILKNHPKGVSYAHLVGDRCPMISDSKGQVLSFPPIINSEETKVNGGTKNLFLEATGFSEEAVKQAVNILVSMLADRGGAVEEITIGKKPYPFLEERKWKLPVKESEKLLGVKLGKAEVTAFLSQLGHRVSGASVFVPGYRTDVMNAVDLVEDVAIGYGYNKFEPRLPSASTVGHQEPENECHEALVGLGFDEVMSWTLSNAALAKKAKLPETQAIEIENPLTEDFAIFRTAILPNLLVVLSESKNEKLPIRIYEAGSAGTPKIGQRLSFASMHSKASFSEIKGVMAALAESGGRKLEIRKAEFGPYVKGRCAAVYLDGKLVGHMGEIAPDVLVAFNLEQPVCAAEINLE